MQIAEVAFIGYPVTDAERARTFYEGVLGLSPSRTFGGGDSVVDVIRVRDRGRSNRLARRRISDRRATPLAGGPPAAINEEFAVVHRVSSQRAFSRRHNSS